MRIFILPIFLLVVLNSFATVFFTENKGQIRDQYYKPRPDVLFNGSANGLYYHLKKDGMHYQLFRVESWKKEDNRKHFLPEEKKDVPDQIGIYRVDVNWLNASPATTIIREKEWPGYTNYYNVPENTEPALFVKSYESIRYQNIYTGIDLHFYTNNGNLEYDFIVHPNSDYKQIKIQIQGAELKVSQNKELIIKTPFGDIVEGALKVYQGSKKIPADWQVENNVVSFNIPNYDKSKPLRIDPPVRIWGTYYGGYGVLPSANGVDVAKACATDTAGHVFIGGNTSSDSPLHIATTGAHQTTYQSGISDIFIAKFNASGVRLWGTYYGGENEDKCNSISTDKFGNVFITGESNSTQGIATPGSFQPTLNGTHSDAFLAKFSADGILWWGTYYGGHIDYDIGMACATDNQGNVYFAGFSSSDTLMATAGAFRSKGPGPFLSKFSASGVRLWSTYLDKVYASGPGLYHNSWPYAIAVDRWNNVFVAGASNSDSLLATPTAHQSVRNGGTDAFVVKFNSTGNCVWCTYYGGMFDDYGFGCAADGAGNVYITGRTASDNNISSAGAFQVNQPGGFSDAFLVKLNGTNGTRVWGTYFGGTDLDEANACAVDSDDKVYLCGFTHSTNSIATNDAHQTTHSGGVRDAFIAVFDTSGQRVWSSYYGGSGVETAFACATDRQGAFYVAGSTNSTDGIATDGAHQTDYNPLSDAFLVKFDYCVPTPVTISSNSPVCAGVEIVFMADSIWGAFYHWIGPGDFISHAQNPVIPNATLAQGGIYTLILTNQAGCNSYASVTVAVHELPSDSIYQAGQVLWAYESGATYQWVDCSNQQPIADATNQSFLPTQNGTFAVIITTPNGCTDTSACYNFTTVRNDEVSLPKLWIIYPNPSTREFTIVATQNGEIELYDITGKRLDKFFVQGNQPFTYHHTLPQGVYILRGMESDKAIKVVVK
ncbi:MAG: SBBP repeat-containing protein [Chitinophagales bacterium]|nr:SBBP repeat-containing protein [Chitinophagales bacterium]